MELIFLPICKDLHIYDYKELMQIHIELVWTEFNSSNFMWSYIDYVELTV